MLLCVFSNDSEGQMLVKQIANCTVFGENQTATTTFITCLTRFRLISHPFENLHRIPTGPWGFITVPVPIPCPYPWESPNPHTHGSPAYMYMTRRCSCYEKEGTKVCRYNWHSACSMRWPFPVLKYKYIFQIKYTEAISSNRARKLLWFENSKMLIALKNNFLV